MDNFLKGLFSTDEHEPTSFSKWVEWEHIPQGQTHCEDCLVLDKCWFSKSAHPTVPLHPYCHCVTKPIPYSRVLEQVHAKSAYSKFDPYLFDPENCYKHGKNRVFESWGYAVADSAWLQAEMEKQAVYKYSIGEYALGRLNKDGQRINIRIELERKDGSGSVSFISGWMVQPGGTLKLNTPYGGK